MPGRRFEVILDQPERPQQRHQLARRPLAARRVTHQQGTASERGEQQELADDIWELHRLVCTGQLQSVSLTVLSNRTQHIQCAR